MTLFLAGILCGFVGTIALAYSFRNKFEDDKGKEIANLSTNPDCCYNCPVYDIEDCSCYPGPDFIEFDDIIDPNCPLLEYDGIFIYLTDEQKKEYRQ